MYPNYRFKPVHNKNKNKDKKSKAPLDEPDERRCEEVAQLLLEGKKGDELAAAVRRLDIDRRRDPTGSLSPMPFPAPSASMYPYRRSSSVPPTLYHQGIHAPIAIPTMPAFLSNFSTSRPDTPVNNIARSNRAHPLRRPSSAGPSHMCTWAAPPMPFSIHDLQADPEPLPAINTSLFEPTFLNQNVNFAGLGGMQAPQDLNGSWLPTANISPLDAVSTDPLSASTAMSSAYPYSAITPAEHMQQPLPWVQHEEITPSASPSGFSASPPPGDFEAQGGLYDGQWAPQDVAGVVHADAHHHHDGGAAAAYVSAEYVDPAGMHMQDYYAGVEHYGAAPGCGLESSDAYAVAYPEDMQFHQPIEISQY